MSILITGVDMPTGCGAITLQIWRDGEVEIYDEEEWKTSKAVAVPPHGRLIDADELYEDCALDCKYEIAATTTRVNEYIQLKIDAAPTVIPAE